MQGKVNVGDIYTDAAGRTLEVVRIEEPSEATLGYVASVTMSGEKRARLLARRTTIIVRTLDTEPTRSFSVSLKALLGPHYQKHETEQHS